MQQQVAPGKYPLSLRLLHWLMAFIIIALLIVGLIMTGLPGNDPLRPTLYALHKSFGLTVFLLAALRLFLRLKEGVPPLPEIIARSERMLAQAGHWAFYDYFALMPLSGYLMTNSFGMPVKWFAVELPRLIGVDKDRGHLLADFHAYAAYTLIGLITLHVLAVVVHYVKERVNLLKRMV